MKLHEYQSKEIFARHGIPIATGEVAETPAEARQIAERIGGRLVIKAQVLVGGRGKAGGIQLADNPDQAERAAARILGMDIIGLKVRKVLVGQAVDIAQEIYLGLVIERSAQQAVMMASAAGGMEIEEVARATPEAVVRVRVDPFLGLQVFQAREVAFGIGVDSSLWPGFVSVARGLYQAFVACDASLAEINPLALTHDGQLLALDAKLVLDDNALFRHPDLAALRDMDEEDVYERQARENRLSYVKLDGDIGCMVNGAGLAMTTMDLIKRCGGAPANFLDIGGGAQADRVAAALRIILSDRNVKAVLINIFGGITRCDEVARGILAALNEVKTKVPMVARLVGTNEAEGRRLLAEAGIVTATSLTEAARKAIAVRYKQQVGSSSTNDQRTRRPSHQ